MQNRASPGCQLYLISPPRIDPSFAERLKSALSAAPVAAFQLRLKGIADEEIARAAEPLQRICADHETAFIINDSMELARQLGADGVHLGQGDGEPDRARALLGPSVQIGVTCHNSRHLAMEAGEKGADYVAFGAFYETGTKNVEFRAEKDILTWWNGLFELPCVAIGGITPDNAPELVLAGADFVAVSGAVWNDSRGPEQVVQDFARCLNLSG
jgi:thiamine-phosphate pyrophosphorylase